MEALWSSGGGHYGGSLSVVDLLLNLYRTRPGLAADRRGEEARDRLILSKGHAAIALYAVLERLGRLEAPLSSYGRTGSPLEGHPDMTALAAVDFSTGSLGQGLAVGLGMAIALEGQGSRVWVVLGDGECQEGQVWEAALLAARRGTANLATVVDANGFQEWGWGSGAEGVPVPDLAAKWRAFGWHVVEVDGHDHRALSRAFDRAAAAAAPTAVVATTVKGHGVPLVEADPLRFHCTEVTTAEHAEILRTLR